MQSGNVDLIRILSAKVCQSCSGLARGITHVYSKGGRVRTLGWKVEQVSRGPGYERTRPVFLLGTRHAQRHLYAEDGSLVDTDPMALVAMRVVLVPHDGAWLLNTLQVVR
jgi:hypothetical protein